MCVPLSFPLLSFSLIYSSVSAPPLEAAMEGRKGGRKGKSSSLGKKEEPYTLFYMKSWLLEVYEGTIYNEGRKGRAANK